MHGRRHRLGVRIPGGEEQNVFYRREPEGLAQQGERRLLGKDVVALGADAIHAVTNPLDKITAAIHVYGGDFFNTPRSEWDKETFEERPYHHENVRRMFEEYNALLRE